jgi:hypothetical protein
MSEKRQVMEYRMSKQTALNALALHALNYEREDYLYYCDCNSIDPKDIQGDLQSRHLYALALIGLNIKFEK